MRAVRYVYVLALALWLGGMALAGFVVAPTIFSVLQASNGSTGRVLAGDLFGAVLHRLYILGGIAGGLMFVALTIQRIIGPRPKAYGVRAALIVVMLAVTGYAALIAQPRIEQIQRSVTGPIAELRADDPRRTEFDALHSLSTTLMSLTIVGGLALVAWETRE
jgi:Ca2+/Na+ antiporter